MKQNNNKEYSNNDVAIVGWSGRFPGAENIDVFWEIIKDGKETITFYSREELAAKGVDSAFLDNPSYVPADSIVDTADKFDSAFFGYSPREADFMDPQHRVFLEECYSALENAGYDPEKYKGEIGVFAGCSRNNYWLKNLSQHLDVLRSAGELQTIVNNDKDFLTTRVSYKLNLTGPSTDIQTACSTSLVAVHYACQSLLSGQCDMALAGGVFVKVPRGEGYFYEEGNIDSSTGHCNPFDVKSVGTIFGEGAGVVVLKRLEDAVADRDTIIAVIKSTAINNDGSLKVGYMAPSVSGQSRVVSKAIDLSGVDPESISYIETHGTGTKLGDHIEIEALTRAFAAKTDKLQFCALGSVKANIGHLDAAAGVAGLIKTALILKKRMLPPLINCTSLNPELNLQESPFYVNTGLKDWVGDTPKRAAVSSFGIGGTNSHAILEEWQMKASEPSPARFHLLPVSAKSEAALKRMYDNLVSYLSTTGENVADIAFTLQNGRKEYRHRGLLITENSEGKDQIFSDVPYFKGTGRLTSPRTVFMFTGQGSQYLNMAKGLYDNFESVKIIMDYADSILKENHNIALLSILFSDSEENADLLNQTSIAQPALFVVQFAVTQLLMEFGVFPDVMTGHSIGEITAACVSGVFTFEDALNLVAWRGKLMQSQVQGSMLSINLPREEVALLLPPDLEISLNNAPNFSVVSGTGEAVGNFEEKLAKERPDCRVTRLKTSHAFHSRMMEPVLEPFKDVLGKTEFGSIKIPFISNVTGTWIRDEEASGPQYWAMHIRSMVNFRDGILELLKDENSIFIEIGPGNTLSTFLSQFPSKSIITSLSTVRHPKQQSHDVEFFFRSISRFWIEGGKMRWDALYRDEERFRVPLPTYPFERTRHWVEPLVPYSYYSTAQSDKMHYNSPQNLPETGADEMTSSVAYHNRPDLNNDCYPPETAAEKTVAGIWEEMLGIKGICVTDNFFELGGHSLLAAQILNRVNEGFSTAITIEKFFSHPTIRGILEGENLKTGEVRSSKTNLKINYNSALPLTKSQERLWIINQIDNNTPAYNISFTHVLKGPLDIDVFRKSLELLFNRHKILKSSFRQGDNGPVVFISKSDSFNFSQADFSGFSGPEQARKIQEFIQHDTRCRFNIETGPLYKISLIHLGRDKTLFHFTVHHLVFDGWSWGIFTRELSEIYNHILKGQKVSAELKGIDYFEFALKEHNEVEGERLIAEKEYWKNKLKGVSGHLDFPVDFKRKEVSTGEGGRVPLNLGSSITAKIKELARRENVTLYMFFLSLFGFLLSRYSGNKDICIGTPTANRRSSELEKLIGLFINSIVLRLQIDESDNFPAFLRKVKEVSLEALANQSLPFEELVDLLQPERVMNINPLFQVMFAWQNAPRPPLDLPGITVERVFQENGASPLDITFYAWEEDGSITGEIEFSSDIFKRTTIEALRENFVYLVEQVISTPDIQLKDLSVISGYESRRISGYNDTAFPVPEAGLHSLFERNISKFSSKIAVTSVETGKNLTYHQLEARANKLAHFLEKEGFSRGKVAGVSLSRSESMVVALLGILKAGGAYLPLDPAFPDERLLYMLSDSGAELLITEESLGGRFKSTGIDIINLDNLDDSLVHESEEPLKIGPDPESLAYMIYTSGSTGKPKGVKVHHRAVVNFINSMAKDPGISPDDRLLAITTLSFDISILEIFLPLSAGATVFIADNSHISDGEILGRVIEDMKITFLQATPTTWTILLASGWKGKKSMKALCGGEALQPGLARDLIAKTGSFWNMYGPTETTVWSSLERITDSGKILVGKPIDNTQFHILTGKQEQPVGATGELCIGGAGVSKGYHNREDLNSEKFISWHDQRLYRTGDLARYRDDGKIELFGRSDNQIKLRGFRIEPGEIEFNLSNQEGIKEAVVKAEKFGDQDTRLTAFLNVTDKFIFDREQIVKNLGKNLPAYMIPTAFMVMKDFPRTLNGKIDRKALIYKEENLPGDAAEAETLQETEKNVADIFQNILRIKNINKAKSFFDVGGNSLLALRVINKIKEELGYSLTFRELIKNPTIAQLSSLINQKTGSVSRNIKLVHLDETGRLPLSKNQQRLWLVSMLRQEIPAYIIQHTYHLSGPLNKDLFLESIKILFNRHRVVFSVIKSENGEPYCVIMPTEVKAPYFDYSGLPESEKSEKVASHIHSDALIPFDLENGPLYRLFLIKSAEDDHYFHMGIHHIIFDGWSWSVFARDLRKIYDTLLFGKEPEPFENEFEIYDYAELEKNLLNPDRENELTGFWTEYLKDASSTLNFPYDYPRKENPSGRGGFVPVSFNKDISGLIKQISNEEGVSLFTALLGAFGIQFNRYTGEDDLCIGMPVAYRPYSGLENIFGMFVNTVVVRLKHSKELTFRNLIRLASESALNSIAHQDLPFENVVEIVNPDRSSKANPIFQVAFVWLKNLDMPLRLSGVQASRIPEKSRTTPFDITLYLWENEDKIEGEIEYSEDLLAEGTMIRFRDNFLLLVENLVHNTDIAVSSLPFITVEDMMLIQKFNDTYTDYPRDKTIAVLFEEQALLYPAKTAVVFKDKSLTYKQLNERANQLSWELKEKGVVTGTPVGLLAEKSLDLIIGILGILKAGGTCVPIDPDYPEQRINFMIADSGSKILLTQDRYRSLPVEGVEKIYLNSEDSFSRNKKNPVCGNDQLSRAYILYTSGTTGKPKGSMIPHRGPIRTVRNTNYIRFKPDDRILMTGAVVFDVSVFEIWGALLNGGTLYIVEKETLLNHKALGEELDKNNITILWLTSALFTHVAEEGTEIFRKLKYLLAGGDVLSAPHVNKVRRENPHLIFINGYGPTENSIFSTTYRVEKDFDFNIPVGKPISNSTCYIFDKYMNYQPVGVIGELYVGGDGLSLGYLNREDINAKSFLEHPFIKGERIYKTGDYARWLPDGNIEFHGRLDNQLKIRGFRVELEEIESVISETEGVVETVVKVVKTGEGDKRLVAFLNISGTFDTDIKEIEKRIRKKLPPYMIPSAFKLMNGFPRNINGKTDRSALIPDSENVVMRVPRDLSSYSPAELTIYRIWSEALRTSDISVDDNFFEIGGNSLMAMSVFSKIEAAFNIELGLRVFFDSPRIKDLAESVDLSRKSSDFNVRDQENIKNKLPVKIIRGEI